MRHVSEAVLCAPAVGDRVRPTAGDFARARRHEKEKRDAAAAAGGGGTTGSRRSGRGTGLPGACFFLHGARAHANAAAAALPWPEVALLLCALRGKYTVRAPPTPRPGPSPCRGEESAAVQRCLKWERGVSLLQTVAESVRASARAWSLAVLWLRFRRLSYTVEPVCYQI